MIDSSLGLACLKPYRTFEISVKGQWGA